MVTLTDAVDTLQRARLDMERSFQADEVRAKLEHLTQQMGAKHQIALASREYSRLEETLVDYDDLMVSSLNLVEYGQHCDTEGTPEDKAHAIKDIRSELADIGKFVLGQKLSGAYDRDSAIITCQIGVGWSNATRYMEQLLNAYTLFAEKMGWSMVEIDKTDPTLHTIEIIGENAYGFFKTEHGVHRVEYRYKDCKPQTARMAIIVEPKIEEPEFAIKQADLDIEHIAASSKGGQHANRSHTGVRITHTPTGVQASACERSQSMSYRMAFGVLQSRVELAMLKAQQKPVVPHIDPNCSPIVRTYDFLNSGRIKDSRTGVMLQNGQTKSFFQGDIDEFIYAAHGLLCNYKLPE